MTPDPREPTTIAAIAAADPSFNVKFALGCSHVTYRDAYNSDIRLPITLNPDGRLLLHATGLPDHIDTVPDGYDTSLYALLVLFRMVGAVGRGVTVRGAEYL